MEPVHRSDTPTDDAIAPATSLEPRGAASRDTAEDEPPQTPSTQGGAPAQSSACSPQTPRSTQGDTPPPTSACSHLTTSTQSDTPPQSSACGTASDPSLSTDPQTCSVRARYRRLLAENRRLRGRQLCRMCGQREISVTLLPCGHFVFCEQCANTLTHCAVCQREILADVRTFLC
ncbi:uncharacterized protein LOC143282508 [Babylonia areolata]|uniref:uncharacterized protein LOC143282508 n=1 Tax=Babylonia areolata TaxID=304850 RepID=UPI003FD276AB